MADDSNKASEQDYLNAKARAEWIKESNNATKESINLSRQLSDIIKQEHEYQSGIVEDKRTSKDLARDIQKAQLKVKESTQEQRKLAKAGRIDEAAKLGVLIKQTKERIKEGKTTVSNLKEIEKLREKDNKRLGAQSKLLGLTVETLQKGKGAALLAFSAKQGASAWGWLKNIIMETSKLTTGLSKSMGITSSESAAMQEHWGNIAPSFGNAAVNLISMQKSMMMLNDQFGIGATVMRDDIVAETTELTRLMGLSNESASDFAQAALISGKNMNQITLESIKGIKAGEKERGVRMNINKVLEATGKVTGEIRAQLGANPAAIAKAITVAKQFGMELDKVAAAGNALLNFEQSIEAELNAELLTGKQLNLERARLAALTGDYETLTREINKNVGDFFEFSKMNVLQQRALAEAHGMTSDQLAQQLIGKQSLAELAEEARMRGDTELEKDLKKQDLAQQFANVQENITAILVQNADKVTGFVEGLVNLSNNAEILKSIVIGIAAIKFGGLIGSMTSLAVTIFTAASGAGALASGLTLGVAAIAIGVGIHTIMKAMNKAKSDAKKMAEGGIVMPRAGGTLATIGERGQAEAIIPLNKMKDMGLAGGVDKETKDILRDIAKFSKMGISAGGVLFSAFDSKSQSANQGQYSSDVRYDSDFS